MKRLTLIIILATILFSCNKFKEEKIIWKGELVEIDAAVLNSVASGRTYPILTRLPAYGRPVISTSNAANGIVADPVITRTSGAIKLRVNLVGAQSSTEKSVTYRVVTTEKDAAGSDVVVTTALEGTHFTLPAKTCVIPPNSSFGDLSIQIINPGATTGTKDLVLELTEDGGSLKPSTNYKKIAIRIAQN